MSELINKVINSLIESNIIPNHGTFDITEEILLDYMRFYSLYKSNTTKLTGIPDFGNYKYARKLAGINLIKHKINKGIKSTSIKEGIVYSISNPAWEDHSKIGITTDLTKRLRSYQTYSPFRDYKVDTYELVFDKRVVEKDILTKFKYSLEQGEWLRGLETSIIIDYLKNNWMNYGPVAQ